MNTKKETFINFEWKPSVYIFILWYDNSWAYVDAIHPCPPLNQNWRHDSYVCYNNNVEENLNHKMHSTFIKGMPAIHCGSSLLITAYIFSLGISYFILSAAPTGQCQSVQWHSHATPTQHPLMGEQVLDRVQWSRAERAAMIYQMNRPALTPLARGRGTQPFIKSVCVCVYGFFGPTMNPNKTDWDLLKNPTGM